MRFLAVGRFRGTSYIAMEYIQGETLEKIIADRGSLPWREVVELGIQICDALHYAHEHGVVHRDLKPSNLMVTADGKIKLTDFGIAKDLDATALTATGRTLGTAAYMSPEQIRGTPAVSHKTDLYALGVVLYQMLTGKPPFEGSTPVVLMHCHLNEPPPRPSAKVARDPQGPRRADREADGQGTRGPALGRGRRRRDPDRAARQGRPRRTGRHGLALTPARAAKPSRAAAAARLQRRRCGRSRTQLARKRRRSGTLASLGRPATASADRPGSLWLSRAVLETGLLVLALVADRRVHRLLGLASQRRTTSTSRPRPSWPRLDEPTGSTARDDYLDPLDKRFPNNPYREQTRKWRDKILLDDAEGRARILTSGVKIRDSTEPANNAERQFVIANELAAEASSGAMT